MYGRKIDGFNSARTRATKWQIRNGDDVCWRWHGCRRNFRKNLKQNETVMTESEVFESVTGSGSSDFAILVRILNTHGTWCLIGGLAVNSYVEPVYTLDADIVVISSELPGIKSDLLSAGFLVEEFKHSLNARMQGSDLRIQLSLDPRYQDFLKRAQASTVLGQQ